MRARSALVVGVGGLGSPAALVLARAGVRLTLLDDDRVEASNLHRQILFGDGDVGAPKLARAAARLRAEGAEVRVVEGRLVPSNALERVAGHDVVVEGADNLATKFLTADACAIAGVPAVQAGAVRWNGWALASLPGASACARCVFEDIPRGRVETCAVAGIVGPVVGVLGALEGALALRVLGGDRSAGGELWSYRGLEGALRRSHVRPRPGCPTCEGRIGELTAERYTAGLAALPLPSPGAR